MTPQKVVEEVEVPEEVIVESSASFATMSAEKSSGATTNTLQVIDCGGNKQCLAENFAACKPVTFAEDVGVAAAYYKILKPVVGGCSVIFKYTKNPNPAWVNKEMTCVLDNKNTFDNAIKIAFDGAIKGTASCVGPFVSVLRPVSTQSVVAEKAPVLNKAYLEGGSVVLEGSNLSALDQWSVEKTTCSDFGTNLFTVVTKTKTRLNQAPSCLKTGVAEMIRVTSGELRSNAIIVTGLEAIATTVYSGPIINKAYVSGNDIFIEGEGLLGVTSEKIEGDTCIVYSNSLGFGESFADKKITLTGYVQCLPKIKPNYILLGWNADDRGTKGKKRVLIEQ